MFLGVLILFPFTFLQVYCSTSLVKEFHYDYANFSVKDAVQYRVCVENEGLTERQCYAKVDKYRPFILMEKAAVYFHYNERYFNYEVQSEGEFCGIKGDEFRNNKYLEELRNKTFGIFSDRQKDFEKYKTMEFCKLTFDEFLPLLCEFRPYCKSDFELVEILFAYYYTLNQVYKSHPNQFSCPNIPQLDGLINPKAYELAYNYEEFLTKPLPCNALNSTITSTKESNNEVLTNAAPSIPSIFTYAGKILKSLSKIEL